MIPGHLEMCWLSELRTGGAYPSTGGFHNDESATVWWDDQLGTVPTGF